MFEVSTILDDDSAELVSGGENGFVKVSLSNFASSSSFEEEALAVSAGGRVVAEMDVDTTLRGLNNFVDFAYMALLPKDQRHQYLRFEGLQYTDADIAYFKMRLGKIYRREDADGAQGCSGTEFREGVLDLDTAEALQFQLGRVESGRQIFDKGDLSTYWRDISFKGDFLGTPPSYTLIRDPMLRLCHRLIACSVAGKSQAPEKVIVTDLFYLRGMDISSVNVPYLLAMYLRLFASGRKHGAMIFEGQFVSRLAEHFGLLTKERLQGFMVIVQDLPVINMASGPERQQVAADGAPKASEDAPIADKGAPAVPAPVQAPQPPTPAAGPAQTMAQRLARVEEDMNEIRGASGEQREILDSMACDFSRFSTWTVVGLSHMMSQVGVRYTSYADFQIPYVRHTRRRTDNASTFTA
ncbi:hypothetical protein Tco_0236273 [Tanacetum coccineum]